MSCEAQLSVSYYINFQFITCVVFSLAYIYSLYIAYWYTLRTIRSKTHQCTYVLICKILQNFISDPIVHITLF